MNSGAGASVHRKETERGREREKGLDKNRSTAVATHGSRNDSLVEEELCVCMSVREGRLYICQQLIVKLYFISYNKATKRQRTLCEH